MKITDRYLKIVEWSEEDGCYVGTVPDLIYGGIHGDNETEVYKELVEAAEEAVMLYKQDGKPLPPPTLNPETLKILFQDIAAPA
jgi:predicted RNase H-like HicB family nuclease